MTMPMHERPIDPGPTVDVLGQLPVGVMLMDARGEVVHANDALRSLWDGLLRQPADAPFPADAHTPDGTPLRVDDWPIHRSLATGEDVRDVPIELERPDDDPVSIVAESRPLIDPGGQRIGAVMVVRDVTQAHDDALLREAFVGILSHELRTPVTSIYSGIELLRGHRLDNAVVRDVLDDVAVEAETLQRLIDDLLVMVRVERGMALGLPEPVHLRHIVALAVADEQRRWPDHAFEVDLPTDLPAALGDDGLIRQVLRNLLSNAAKYGPANGTVRLSGEAIGDEIELRVSDDGPGIELDQRQRVFELFYRGSTAARIAGSGIGLYVARVLMEAMGGSIRVSPRDRGAEFVLRLPIYVDLEAGDPVPVG
jgi:signal transduction histidine kinase